MTTMTIGSGWACLWTLAGLHAFGSAIATPGGEATRILSRQDTGNDDDGLGFGEENVPVCDYTQTFDNMDTLNAASKGFRGDCNAYYALDTLSTMLDAANANYTNVNQGYDAMFPSYITYNEKLVQPTLDDSVMFNKSVKNEDTMSIPIAGPGMAFFNCKTDAKDSTSFPCTDLKNLTRSEEMSEHKTTLTLVDAAGFNKSLVSGGLVPDWVIFGDHEVDHDFSAYRESRTFKYKFAGFPIQNPKMIVPNPKEIATKALATLPDLHTSMSASLVDMILGDWDNGSVADAAQAYSVPVFMFLQAVDNMAHAKALGQQEIKDEKQEAERKKNFILMIVSVVLMFVPVIGEEVAMAAGLADLARACVISGEVEQGAMLTYDLVKNPQSAIADLFGMILGVGAVTKVARNGAGFRKAAQARLRMTADQQVGHLGALAESLDIKFQEIMNRYC